MESGRARAAGRAVPRIGKPELALADAERYREIFPQAIHAITLQTTALEQLGRSDEALDVWQSIAAGDAQQGMNPYWDHEFQVGSLDRLTSGWPMLTGLAVTLLLINIWIGRRQRREGGGTWRRLIAVAGVTVIMQLTPLVCSWAVAESNWLGHPPLAEDWRFTTLVLIFVCGLGLFNVMRPTVRFMHAQTHSPWSPMKPCWHAWLNWRRGWD